MERKLFEALVEQCEMSNAYLNTAYHVMREMCIQVLRNTYEKIGLTTCLDRKTDGTIINVEMYKDSHLIAVSQILCEGK